MSRPFKSLLRSFTKVAGAGLAGAFLLSAAGDAARHARTANPPVPDAVTGIAQETPPADVLFNTGLLDEARGHASELAHQSPGAHDGARGKLQADMNAWLKKHPNQFYDRSIVFDTDAFDIYRALGMAGGDAARQVLADQGYAQARPANTDSIAVLVETSATSAQGNSITGILPLASAMEVERKTCLFVPAPDTAWLPDTLRIEGLDRQTTLDLINAHEKWHCKDNAFTPDEDKRYSRMIRENDLGAALNDPAAHAAFALQYKKEALADVGALGDLIRAGRSPAVIGPVADWRAGHALVDMAHCDAPVLKAMRKGIEKMGVEAFRAMTDAQAEKFYVGLVENNGLPTAASWNSFLTQFLGDGAAFEKMQKSVSGKDFERGHDMLVGYVLNPRHAAVPFTDMPEMKIALPAQDPLRDIQDAAFKNSGVITPETMISAYTGLQNDLRERMKRDPANDDLAEKSILLRTAFRTALAKTDYIAENARRGVDIRAARRP